MLFASLSTRRLNHGTVGFRQDMSGDLNVEAYFSGERDVRIRLLHIEVFVSLVSILDRTYLIPYIP